MGLLDDDRGFTDIERGAKGIFGAAIAVWIIGALASLAVTGVVIWAIVQLVQHFTA